MNAQARARWGVEVLGPRHERSAEVLTPAALELLLSLHLKFNPQRLELLAARERRQAELDAGAVLDFLPDTASIRSGEWRIAAVPPELQASRLEIAGSVGDFEDACSPTWANVIEGQVRLADALRATGRRAAPIVRPRGWHLPEKHVRIEGESGSGALFDVAIYLANNVEAFVRRGTVPRVHLPKLESHLEARLWEEVLRGAEAALGIGCGTVRATVAIETLPAAFEMEEILYELRERALGLSFERRDYLFSFIKKFRAWPDFLLPDCSAITPEQHFFKSCVALLTQTCQRRGAYAAGGRPVQVPSARVLPGDLLRVPQGDLTEEQLRACIRAGVQYLEAWVRGVGHVRLYEVLEDAATAELCRAQLWQCLQHRARTSDGRPVTAGRFDRLLMEELDRIHDEVGPKRLTLGVFPTATRLFEQLVKQESFEEFFTTSAYEMLP